jgi:hypothetical protein
MRSRFASSIIAAAPLLCACNEGPTVPYTGVAAIEITPAAPLLIKGDSLDFTAIARAASGAVVSNAQIIWNSSAPDVVEVSATGRAAVLNHGEAWVKASSIDGTVDSVHIVTCPEYARTGNRYEVQLAPGDFPNSLMDRERFIYAAAMFDRRMTMWGGTLMFGTSSADLVFAMPFMVFSDSPAPSPYADPHVGICQIQTPNGHYTRTNILMTPAGGSPLRVEQESFAPNLAAAHNVVLLRYTFRNTSNAPVNGLRVGLIFDWDVAIDNVQSVGANYSRFNQTLNAAEVYEEGRQTAGLAGVDLPITTYRGMPHYTMGRFTRADYFNFLAAGVVDPAPVGPADIYQLDGFGPFTIAPGQSQSVTIVLTAGYSPEEFAAGVAAARSLANAFPRSLISLD